MAQSPQSLNALYTEALTSVTATPENWLGFLESAGRNYRYSFPEQLLIHQQKPNATAVLEIQQWNKRFGRWVNRGATGIAVLDRSHSQTRVKYYFDISDTHPGQNASPVPLWSREAQDTEALLSLMQREYRAEAPVLPVAIFEAAQNCTSAMVDLRWEEIQLAEIPVPQDDFQQLLQNSVSFLLLTRLNLSNYAHFYPQDFDALAHFRNPEAVTLLGDMVNNISAVMLTEIARTVRQNHLIGPTFFAPSEEIRYDDGTNENALDQGGQAYGDDLQNGQRLSAAQHDRDEGAGGDGEIRPAERILPEGAPAQPLSDAADQRNPEPAPDGNSDRRTGDNGQPAAPAPEGGGRDRGTESPEPHGMGGTDEQPTEQRRGDSADGTGIQLNLFGEPEPEPRADAPGSFVISQAEIDAELRSGSGFAGGRERIYAFYQNYATKDDAVAFLKKEYGIGGHSHTFLDESRGFVDYEPAKGMTMRHYPTQTELRLRWPAIEDRIRLMVRENTYLSPEEVLQWEANHLEAELPEDFEEVEKAPEEISIPAQNFRITDDTLGHGSVRQKFQNNIAATQLLKELEAQNRNATHEEQEVLSRYVGWGGMPQAFDPENDAWSREYSTLKELLDDHEYAAARESTLNAHFTSPTVIRGIYEGVGKLGFTSGNILEPACGVGNFFGMLPEAMSDSRLYGVELDSVTGRIARKLYPEADITVAGFETTDRKNFYDLAIGNVPFGDYKVNDKAYNKLNFSIHNYFFAKTIDQVRPGGIVAFVTSRYTMDSKSPEVREYIAQRAELLGAIRLPNNAFQANAGTNVVSDILFLQKRERPMTVQEDWVHLDTTEDGFTMNSYFVQHPEMVLGELAYKSTMYGREELTVNPITGADLGPQLHEAVQHIRGAYVEAELMEDAELDDSIPADPNVKNFSYAVLDNQVYYRENSRMKPVPLSATAESRMEALIELRDCVRTLIAYETEDYADETIWAQQAELNRVYDAFYEKYGTINSRTNRNAFADDDSYYLLCSLEILDDEGNLQRKADIFSKRTIRARTVIQSVSTSSEALTVCLNQRACVDLPFMAALTGKSIETIIEELQGVIYQNPESSDWETAEEYLSGNVRQKLQVARDAAEENPDFLPNVAALEQVQPKDLNASEISVRLGTAWLPESDVEQFIYDLLQPAWYLQRRIRVHYSQYTGEWQVEGKSIDRDSVYAHTTYGTDRINAYHIIESTLNLRDVRIMDYVEGADGKRKAVLNKKETAIAQGKQEQIKATFTEWVWKDPERRNRLTRIYNEKFNSLRPREYDGSHIVFEGMSPEITLRPHQKNAIAHALYGGNTLLAHCVGAGKTFEMVAIAQESKRLGLCSKSLIVVPNHLIGQWASEYLQLYPAANILVARKEDFTPANRKTFCSRIATGDYDAVIIGHSQFEKIPLSAERQAMYLDRQIDEIMAGIQEAKRNHGDNFTIKQLERSRKSAQAKLDKLNDQSRKDDVVTFEELGVDRLFVDEAHEFKNLAVISKMRNVSGITQTESQKASDLYMKCQYLDELTGGQGVIFGTGTPVSNSMVELYTMQRYLQYQTLREHGLQHFDAWAANFGETVTAIELAPEGTGYRTKTRFSRFYNLPELMAMFKEVADVQTADMLKLPVPEAHFKVQQLKPSSIQKSMVAELSERADKVRNGMVDVREDNMLKITSDGRKLALDQRLMNPMLPDDENSKSAACAKNVYDIWQRTADNKGSQIVFCDLSTPHFDGKFNIYDDLRSKLTAMGIPGEEIVFIHEAGTEAKKKELYQKVRSGQVRVLIGSTAKMGTGTNVQTRLAALHDLDCPWRPSDLEQRSGRIIRQGNTYPEVDIYRYVTEETFDAYSWQIIETKQKFISQVITSKAPARSMEEADETALSYAELKALATGNPMIKEKMDLDVAVTRLKMLKSSFLSQKYSLEDQIHNLLPNRIRGCEQQIANLTADIAQAEAPKVTEPGKMLPMTIQGRTFTEKKNAGAELLAVCKSMTSPEPVLIGSYRGFDMELSFETFTKEFQLSLKHTLSHKVPLGTDVLGNLQRIDNALDGLPAKLEATKRQLETTRQQLETAKAEVAKPFPQEQELGEKEARLQQLNSMLNMDVKDAAIIEDGDLDVVPTEKNRSLTR